MIFERDGKTPQEFPLHRRSPQRRSGYVFVYFAMLSFALLAVAALTIDMGFVVLTRRQMQTGVDPAVLDGLRFRDAYPPQWIDPGTGSLAASIVSAIQAETGNSSTPTQDEIRRWAAQQMVVNTFDDDLNTADGDTSNFGAGPVISFENSPGIPGEGQDIAASQTILIGSPYVYKPSDAQSPSDQSQWHFWMNEVNNTEGDIVGGNYTYTSSNYNPAVTPVVEDDAYNRVDFQPVASTASPPAASFLVRLKRSNEEPIPSVFSTGPTLPYLFGWGSMIQTQATQSGTVWAKSQGITARATGIANATPALFVGGPSAQYNVAGPAQPGYGGVGVLGQPPNINYEMAGAAPLALSTSFWSAWAGTNSPLGVQVNDDGTLTATSGPSSRQLIGMVIRVTYLAQAVGASDTTIDIVSPAGFPVEQFQLAIISNGQVEQMLVPQASNQTSFNTTTWTVARGINGTTAISHSAGDMVVQLSGASLGQTVTYPSTDDPNNSTRMQNQSYPPPDSTNQTAVYAPLYASATQAPGVNWIVAFGAVNLSVTSSGPPVQFTLSSASPVTNSGYVAPANAMGVPSSLYGALNLLALDQNDSNTLLTTLYQATAGVTMSVLAPTLVRSE
jgi:Putative Flp pilus-assembly TadE/G-like